MVLITAHRLVVAEWGRNTAAWRGRVAKGTARGRKHVKSHPSPLSHTHTFNQFLPLKCIFQSFGGQRDSPTLLRFVPPHNRDWPSASKGNALLIVSVFVASILQTTTAAAGEEKKA